MTKKPTKAQKKIAKVMREYSAGTLHSGSKKGPVVKSAAQARAIAMSEIAGAPVYIVHLSSEDALNQVREARDVCAKHGADLIVNDYWRVAIDEKCTWVHLGQEDLIDADVKAIRGAGLKLGISTHDHAELEKGLAADPDYVALGPIWPTALKKMPWAPQGLQRIGEWMTEVEWKAMLQDNPALLYDF